MDIEKGLKDGAARLGVALSKRQLDSFALYLSLLLKWNARVNLTAVADPPGILVKHFLDSLALCRMVPEVPFSALDIGSGAGFPGLPIKIARPDIRLVLVEPARKKAAFLRQVVRVLGLGGVEVAEARAEALPAGYRGGFDVALSRAFKEPAVLLGLAGEFLKEGGIVALSLGPGMEKAPPPGWTVSRREEITLPSSGYTRILTAYTR